MSKSQQDRRMRELIKVSELILNELEDGKALEDVVSKCKKLARLRNDEFALKWFTLELNGYDYNALPTGINPADVYLTAQAAGRAFLFFNNLTQKNEPKFWPGSISSIEASIKSCEASLKNLRLPTTFTPAITRMGDQGFMGGATFVNESFRDVLGAIRIQQTNLSGSIDSNRALLAKIRSRVYDYVLSIYLQLKFENITETLFQETKTNVDKELQRVNPEIMKKFVAAYDRLKSNNPEEWSQAMSSCRNALKAFSDSVFPPQKEKYKTKDGREIEVSDIKVKNRLIAYIDSHSKSSIRRLLIARTSDLENRIHTITDMLSQGTHEGLTKTDVNMCVLDTYLLIGSLLEV